MTTKITETDTVFALDIDEPAPEPAAPAYDVDAPDSEWDGVPVVSVAMALDVLRSGRTLMAAQGALQITADATSDDEVTVTIWNTLTCVDVVVMLSIFSANHYLNAFANLTDGAWHVHCPDEPDGAPLY